MIELINNYYIEPEPGQYVLRQRGTRTTKTGEKVETSYVCGYYVTIASAVKAARRRVCHDATVEVNCTLSEFIEIIKEIDNRFAELLDIKLKEY